MKKIIVFVAACAAAWLTGCTTYSVQSTFPKSGEQAQLQADKGVVIMASEDGRYNTTTYSGSGLSAAARVQDALMGYFGPTNVIQRMSEDAALVTARSYKADYLCIVQILHWEDRATNWSGKVDRVNLQLLWHEVGSGALVDVLQVQSDSTGAWRGDKPEDCIYRPLREYLVQRFGDRGLKL